MESWVGLTHCCAWESTESTPLDFAASHLSGCDRVVRAAQRAAPKVLVWSGTVEMAVRSTEPWARERNAKTHTTDIPPVNLAVLQPIVVEELLDTFELWASCPLLGFQDLYLHVLENNYQARQLYFKLGYQLSQVDSSWVLGYWDDPAALFYTAPERCLPWSNRAGGKGKEKYPLPFGLRQWIHLWSKIERFVPWLGTRHKASCLKP